MAENLYNVQYDVTKKSKILKFYESNKILIFSFLFILVILLGSFVFHLENKEKKRILAAENYLNAKIYLSEGDRDKGLSLLKKVIFANDPTYSTLCLFIIMNQDLITDYNELSILFDHLLENNKYSKELRNLLIYKKALFDSNFVNESELLESISPLLRSETLWKPHALILLGDYFMSKGERVKAVEFYQKILSINNLHQDLYNKAISQLTIISDEK